MRQLLITVLMIAALVAFGATAASAGCCQPKCKQHTCSKCEHCAPKCHPCKVDCCKPKCEPCVPKCEPAPKPEPKPCYCCPFGYTIKVFGYDMPCPEPPAGHPGTEPEVEEAPAPVEEAPAA
jgi:hypothetical protein